MSSKKRANLKDQKTGLSLNPFWFTHYCPEDLAALKNGYPKDDEGNVLQLLHDSAIDPTQPDGTESYNVEIACCPHTMGGLLKDKATTNAYIWGEYNDQYIDSGTLWYNDLTNKEVGPLDVILSYNKLLPLPQHGPGKNFDTFKLTNPNYFNIVIPWKLYSEREIIFEKIGSGVNAYLKENPASFSCGIKILKNHPYRIYYSDFNCSGGVTGNFSRLNLRVEISVDGEFWEPVKIADGSGGGADFILDAYDSAGNPIKAGYVDIINLEYEYNYMRVKQYWGNTPIPNNTSDPGSWITGGGGEAYAYIKSIPYFRICAFDTTHLWTTPEADTSEKLKELVNGESKAVKLIDYLNINDEVTFEYQTKISLALQNYLTSVGTIINRGENPVKKQSLIKPTSPIITAVSTDKIECFYPYETLNLYPGSSLTDVTLFIAQYDPDKNELRMIAQQQCSIGSSTSYTLGGLQPGTTYSLFASVIYNSGGQSFTYYSDMVEFKTAANNMFKIKFRSDFSNHPAWAAYETDNTTVTIARGKQLVAWTQKMPFYHPTATASRGYYVEIDTTDTLLGEVTGIDIEGTLSYNLDDKEVKCLLPNTYIIAGKDFWDKKVDGKTVYGKSFKYTYGTPATKPGDSSSYDSFYHAKYIAGDEDTIKIVVRGNSTAGNPIQYETNYVVYAPMVRANRD